jgi:geranylgeranyl diphosphate synthase type II
MASIYLAFLKENSNLKNFTLSMYTAEYLLHSINEALDNENFHKEPIELYEPITYIFSLGGKRIRPVMLLMAADMYGGDIQQAMPAALGIEIFHNFSLIHDDIMDRAPLRRGRQTVHEKWNANMAILSGDTMLVKAYEQFLKLPEPLIKPALTVFSLTATGVCEGQQLDMNFEEKDDVTIAEYLEMIRLKTAVLIGAALKLGSLAAGAPDEDQQQLFDFGIHTGLLFQLRDDFLDTYGNAEVFGKKQYGDIIANKKTYLYLKALEYTAGKERRKLAELYANRTIELKKVLNYFDDADVKEQTENKIQEYYELAREAFMALKVPEEIKKPLRDYTQQMMERSF